MNGEMGRVEGEGPLLKVISDHQGWLTLEDADGKQADKKCRKGDFVVDEDAKPFDEGGEVFLDDDGNIVDAEGNEVVTEETDGEEGEDEDDKEAKPMYALQRRKAEGAYETITLPDGKKSLVSIQHRQKELDDYAGDPDGAIAYVEKEMGLDEGTLAAKYAHLNAGQKRMNAGNRLRAFRAKEAMLLAVGEDLGLDADAVVALAGRVGKGAVTEKKIRAIRQADLLEAAKSGEDVEAAEA